MPFEVGQRVGDYEIVQLLGAGGMGHVYRVRNIITNRTEAMKVLLPDLTAELDLAKRFVSEIRTLASFDHPNIAQLHTALMAENQLAMMMEYVEGSTLEQIAGQKRVQIEEIAGYVMQALSALAYAHERGVVHRDIKPANLMVTSHGVVKLMDFGIAKSNNENMTLTRPGTTIGSMYYMSPEQVRGDAVDARSDLYSMGVVLYELLAGRKPFESDSTFGILNQQLNTAPQPPMEVNPALPQGLNDVILRALAKDPAQRFQNAEEFRAALRPFASGANGRDAAAAKPVAQTVPMAAPMAAGAAMAAGAEQVAAGAQGGFAPEPAFAAVNPPANGPRAVEAPRGVQVPPPTGQRAGSRTVWIATGAIAAALALIAIFALPMLRKTNAASDKQGVPAASAPESAPASAPAAVVTAPAPSVETTPTPAGAGEVAAKDSAPARAAGGANGRSSQPVMEVVGRPSVVRTSPSAGGHAENAAAAGNAGSAASAAPAAAAPGPSAELMQAEERMGQMSARANAAKRGVGQIRSQQEAQGLGMRGDIEAAEGQLDVDMNSAGAALARGDGAAATRALDRADSELSKLEKFLGR